LPTVCPLEGDTKYREIVWKIEDRGQMGENLVGCCLMQGGPIHTELAIRLLNEFPKLVNDVMLSEDYYGNFVLVSFNSHVHFYKRSLPSASGHRERGSIPL
jgi:hypothetical protein